ncbi:MAG: hypothetical protein C5S52_00525 [ANME-2 cluster archaeon]|nr:hypothetical protein [ANME-2 cluster archaeon]
MSIREFVRAIAKQMMLMVYANTMPSPKSRSERYSAALLLTRPEGIGRIGLLIASMSASK